MICNTSRACGEIAKLYVLFEIRSRTAGKSAVAPGPPPSPGFKNGGLASLSPPYALRRMQGRQRLGAAPPLDATEPRLRLLLVRLLAADVLQLGEHGVDVEVVALLFGRL